MVLRDGSHIDDIYYDGGDSVAVKVLRGRDDTEWRVTPLSAMPHEWLSEVRAAVDVALGERSRGCGRIYADKIRESWLATKLVVVSRPSEYEPNWVTSPPMSATGADAPSGSPIYIFSGSPMCTTKPASGRPMSTESDLHLHGLKAGVDVGTNEVSACVPGADAPAATGSGFERCWRAYGRYGNKQASRQAFDAITDPDADHIAERAAAWAASAKPGQRRMPLERWLEAEKYDEADRSARQKPTSCALGPGHWCDE
jgi:hypothetical protein